MPERFVHDQRRPSERRILFRIPDDGNGKEDLFPTGDRELIHHFLLHHHFHCRTPQGMPHLLPSPV